MLTTELCARLAAEFSLKRPGELSCFVCRGAVLEPEELEEGMIFIGQGQPTRADCFYLLCGEAAEAPNAVYYSDPAMTLPLLRAVNRYLEPQRRLERSICRLERACLDGGLRELLRASYQEFGNPVLIVDNRFQAVAQEPERPLGINSWDRILEGDAPHQQELDQTEQLIKDFVQRNETRVQLVHYIEQDGRKIRRIVGPVLDRRTGKNCGGLEVIELEKPFTKEDRALAQRLAELLQHYLVFSPQPAQSMTREERLLQELLFCEPSQRDQMQKRLKRFPALEGPERFYLASIPMSRMQQLTSMNQQVLLQEEYPKGWFVPTETTLLLLLPGSQAEGEEERLLERLRAVGQRMEQTVILSLPFPSVLQLGTVWRFNQDAAAAAQEMHCGAGSRSAGELFREVLLRTVTHSANLRAFVHPMLQRLTEYDRVHETKLLNTLNVYLTKEANLHETAKALFIHRNTLVYRLQRIRSLLGLELDDPAVRGMLRVGCALLEYYQERVS